MSFETNKFRVLVDKFPVAVAVVDNIGKYTFVNSKFTELFGYTLEDIPQKREWYEKIFQDKQLGNRTISANGSDPNDYMIAGNNLLTTKVSCKNKTKRIVELLPVVLKTGEQFIVYNDITDQKMLEAQLFEAQKMESLVRLAGGVTHDFNNLITVVIGYSEMVLSEFKPNDTLREIIEEIRAAGRRASEVTRQLLTFFRRQHLDIGVLHLAEIITDTVKMLKHMIGEDIEIRFSTESDLMPIKTEIGQIEMLLLNMAVNARDAMPSGGIITIETANISLTKSFSGWYGLKVKPGPYVKLTLSDTGIGMDRETKARLFEPFFTTKKKDTGTGLGLSIVHRIVQQHNGTIRVISEPRKGATFEIYFPAVEDALEKKGGESASKASLDGVETILIVEDDEALLKLVKRILKRHGYNVLEANEAMEALNICQEFRHTIHMLITDVVLPGMDGLKVAEQIVSCRPEIKVLYMSGYTGNTVVHNIGFDSKSDFITKPFSAKALVSKVRYKLNEINNSI